jgi:poly(hydroxyalkanoate) depolymerase family esterase
MSQRNNGFRRVLASRLAWLCAAPLAFGAGLLASAPASAASLVSVSGWQMGTEPSNVSMYEYAPDGLPANAPVLVLVHYCSGNAAGIFGEAQSGGIVTQADQKKILLVVPQTSRNCWDVATTASLTHGMASETKAIVDQVKYAITKHNANANRVYVMGASSGAMVTQALLAVYPDVFKAGAEFAGVPAGCWSASDPDGQWSTPCANGQVLHTPQEWGDMARAMYPGYTGFRPRIQLWHGSADSIINYANYGEAVDQWTNVLGLPATPNTTGTVSIGGHNYNRRQWKDSCGIVVLDAFDEPGGPHGPDANMNGQYSLPFMNLDQATFTATDPQAAGCGSTGTGGAGGATGAGGTTGAGGRGGTTGTAGTTGAAGRGGTTGSAGTTGTGGRGGTTGAGGNGPGTGGSGPGTGGSGPGTAGSIGSGEAGTTGTGTGTGGDGNTSGVAGTTGSGEAGTTGSGTGSGGDGTISGAAGSSGSAGTTGQTGTTPGCACEVSNGSGAGSAFALLGIVGVILGRRRAKKRSAR